MLPVAPILAMALHGASFMRLGRRVRAGSLGRGKAMGLYALIGLVPTVVFVGLFLLLVGAEELFGVALISEGYARGAPIIGGFLLLLWILSCVAFAFYSLFARRAS